MTVSYDEASYTPNAKLQRIAQLDPWELPDSYRTNTKKEERMLEYVDRFVRQFTDLHPERRPLLLAPRNECGRRKFICTTLRPTQIPYTELYDLDSCATFVSEYITYEPLDLQASLPSHVPSPDAVMGWQAGDCFDCAQLLCSLLLGVGYDAYVVSGYAPKAVTLVDQTDDTMSALLPPAAEPPKAAPEPKKYAVRPRKVLESRFLKKKEEEMHASEEASEPPKEKEELPVDDPGSKAVEEDELMDELHGKRVHAWVMVLAGKRMLEQTLFVEPTTGRCYKLDASPYFAIESLWNASNYWVNMQGPLPPSKLSYDLYSPAKWEYLLVDLASEAVGAADAEDDPIVANEMAAAKAAVARTGAKHNGSDDANEGDAGNPIQSMEMPPSWVAKLAMERERFQARCPSGHRLTVYRKARLERYSPYAREDGLIERITVFTDVDMLDEHEVRETFANRKDKLASRTVYRAEAKTVEKFEPGRSRALKELITIDGVRREAHFYDTARLDGLKSRVEVFRIKTTLTFSGERDTLLMRTLSYAEPPEGSGSEPVIRKMTERFRRTPELDSEVDIAKRTYNMANGTIKVRYHYGRDRATASSRTFSKAGHHVVQVDPFSKPPTDAVMLDEYGQLQQAERECLNQIREADRQAKELLQRRDTEEALVADAVAEDDRIFGDGSFSLPAHLLVSVYDTERSRLALKPEKSEDVPDIPHDFLTPFLPRQLTPGAKPLTREEALKARDDCLRSLKDRLVERATIVQSRLDEENAALSKRQASFQRNRDHMEPSDEAEYERYCQEAMFRIQILEQRLDRHTELSLHKYAEMDARLRADARLSALSR